MKTLKFGFTIIILLFLLWLCVDHFKGYKVLKVIDGDTIYVDLNRNNKAETEEKIRIKSIDTFETKYSYQLSKQSRNFGITKKQALGLGYLGKEFAKKKLLNKRVKVVFDANRSKGDYGRKLAHIYINGKNYEKLILKEGLAVVYKRADDAKEYLKYENIEKIKQNAQKARDLDLVILNLKNNKYHKPYCKYAHNISKFELIEKKNLPQNAKQAGCCKGLKDFKKNTFNYKDNSLEVYFFDPNINYFNQANEGKYALIKAINDSKNKLYFAIYGISNYDIMNALIAKYENGIDVQWVTDINKYGKNNYSKTHLLQKKIHNFNIDKIAEQFKANRNQKFEYYIDGKKYTREFTDSQIKYFTDQLMHNKFFIFDNDLISTGSVNMSVSGIEGQNANDLLIINSPKINQIYTQEFQQMKSGLFHKQKKKIKNKKHLKLDNGFNISVYFAPYDNDFMLDVIQIINEAKDFIYIPMFFFTDKKIPQTLINAKERGVDVRVILDATSAARKYSKHEILREAGIKVKVENWAGKMHMKALITECYVVTGSLNWTNRAQFFNDENSLIIKNKKLSSIYKEFFLSLYESIPNKWLTLNPRAESWDSKGSCKDGIDNDHDGYTDLKDFDCSKKSPQGVDFEDYYHKQN